MVPDKEDSQNHLQTTNQTCYRTWITEELSISYISLHSVSEMMFFLMFCNKETYFYPLFCAQKNKRLV